MKCVLFSFWRRLTTQLSSIPQTLHFKREHSHLHRCICINYLVVFTSFSILHTIRPLHIAARNGLATVVEVLLTRGATVLAIDQDGESLHAHHIAKKEPKLLTLPIALTSRYCRFCV